MARHRAEAVEWFRRAQSLARQGDPLGAVEAYRRAIELDERFSQAHCNLGILLGRLGPAHARGCLDHLRRAAELSPRSARAHYNLGVALAQQAGAEAEARRAFETALGLEPGHAGALHALSVRRLAREAEAPDDTPAERPRDEAEAARPGEAEALPAPGPARRPRLVVRFRRAR